MLDLIFAARGLNPTLPLAALRDPSSLRTQVGSEHRLYMEGDLEQFVKFELAFRFDTFQPDFDWSQVREFGLPNATILDGLHSVNNFDPILPARYVAWLQRLEAAPIALRNGMLRLADVGWQAVLTGTSIEYESVESPVRAWVVPQAEWVRSSEEGLMTSTAPGFDPRQTVLVEAGPSSVRTGGAGRVLALDDPGPNRVVLSVSAPKGGWLVLADSWFPGWSSRIDGDRGESFVANGLMRSVWLPPGDHSVEFNYLPSSVLVGLAISVLAWPTLVALLRRA
jgi:hypothetical protein